MRTRVIPAQITTVEDRIAGNLNFAQVLLLMVPIFWSAIVYVIFPMPMKLTLYKLPLILIVTSLSFILAIRIKGKLILQWLTILLRFNLRPKYYVFDKNDHYLRVIDLPDFEKKKLNLLEKTTAKAKIAVSYPNFDIKELHQFEKLVQDPSVSLSYKSNRIGGKLNVAFKQVGK